MSSPRVARGLLTLFRRGKYLCFVDDKYNRFLALSADCNAAWIAGTAAFSFSSKSSSTEPSMPKGSLPPPLSLRIGRLVRPELAQSFGCVANRIAVASACPGWSWNPEVGVGCQVSVVYGCGKQVVL